MPQPARDNEMIVETTALYETPQSYLFFALGAVAFYVLGFVVLYRLAGFGSSIIAVIPVIVIAWLYGFGRGFCAGILAAPVNILMYLMLGEHVLHQGFSWGTIIIGTTAVTFIGAMVGRLRDVSLQLRFVNRDLNAEVKERKRAEHELMLHRDHLDELVKTRTVELQEANQQLLTGEAELRESKEFIENVFETTGDGIFVTDAQGLLVMANRTFYKMTGYTEPELIGKHVTELAPTALKPGTGHPLVEQLFTEGIVKGFESKQVKKDGTTYPVELNITTLQDNKHQLIGSVCSVRDITKRKQMEAKAQRQQEQLIQAAKMASLGTLVAGIAHEINNPVNLIMINLPLVQDVWRDAKPVLEAAGCSDPQKKFGGLPYGYVERKLDTLLDDMGIAASRIAKIVESLKSFSRHSSYEDKRHMDINEAVKNAVTLSQTALRKAGVDLDLQLVDKAPLMQGMPQQIEQVILNLLINAIEAVEHEHGLVTIKSGFREKTREVFVTVNDNGCGIDPKVAENIFDPFFTDKQERGGTGLGLSITYNLVQDHDGTITFESTLDKGTTFVVSFPIVT